ncbi:MAG TPA: biopolymer transporter ExbD [Gemmatimonadaceae bacterium]|jgi:biopolymer transport protein ExbD|nr:biopolymer transporter ExbD [Gemmatimonadaceae bacterium]
MAMSVGNERGGLTNEPNVVPMIDILLVLLIIFMLMQPMLRKAIDLQLPDPTPQPTTTTTPPNQIVLEIGPNGEYLINKEAVARDRLGARLKEIYDPRPEKIIFLKADGKNMYQDVIEAMDVARGSGVKVIGIPPKS